MKNSSCNESEGQSPFIPDEKQFVQSSLVSKSSDNENEHKIKIQSKENLNEMKPAEEASEATKLKTNHSDTTNVMQAFSMNNKNDGSLNRGNRTTKKSQVKQRNVLYNLYIYI